MRGNPPQGLHLQTLKHPGPPHQRTHEKNLNGCLKKNMGLAGWVGRGGRHHRVQRTRRRPSRCRARLWGRGCQAWHRPGTSLFRFSCLHSRTTSAPCPHELDRFRGAVKPGVPSFQSSQEKYPEHGFEQKALTTCYVITPGIRQAIPRKM